MFFVYILRCNDNSYYTGHTDNLEMRMYQHNNSVFPTCYTATKLPVELLYSAQFPSRIEALVAEKQIKGWSRKKKEALIKGSWEELAHYAKRKKKPFPFETRATHAPQGERRGCSKMVIIPVKAFVDNYIWVIPNEGKQTFICVDPGDAKPVIEFSNKTGLILEGILITHHHQDHAGGIRELCQVFANVQVFGPSDTRIDGLTTTFNEETCFSFAGYQWQVLFTPGHTSSHISYYEPNQGWLFCGDTLFSGGCGRVFDGSIEALHQSLQRYSALPLETLVFCAHEYTKANLKFGLMVEPDNINMQRYLKQLEDKPVSLPSTIALEKDINPFLRTHESEVIAFALKHGAKTRDSLDVFQVLRAEKNRL